MALAARLVFDSISYSNSLPPWSDPVMESFAGEEGAIRKRISKYLDGETPSRPFTIAVPKRSGDKKYWQLPSVADQIVIQASVSAIAEKVHKTLDQRHVWSYRYNTNPNHVQLTESQISLWKQFQDETDKRCKTRSGCLLQLDLENTFESINRDKFFAFLEEIAPKHVAVSLLKHVVESISGDVTGLPLINDSMFFLANAYLTIVDQIISRHTDNFIRFVDDYRIFGTERGVLESILGAIEKDITAVGFKLNKLKTKLGSGEEYLEALANGKYATTTVVDGYVSAVVLDDVAAPELVLKLVARALENPDELLTEGFGRLSIGAIRRIRLNHLIAQTKNYPSSPFDGYINSLLENKDLISRAAELLATYATRSDEQWRAAWLINLLEDVPRGTAKTLDDLLEAIIKSDNELLRLFAVKAVSEQPTLETKQPSGAEDLGYLEWGRHLWGQR